MDVRNCARCNKIFRSVGGRRVCNECVLADREEYEAVRDYLLRFPGSNVIEVSQATGVPVRKIQEYVREGRLVIENQDWNVKCEECGTRIPTGRLCAVCRAKLEQRIRGENVPPRSTYRDVIRRDVPKDRFRRR